GLQQTFCYCTNLSIIYVASNFTNPYPCSTICFRDCTNLSGYYVKNNEVKANAFVSANNTCNYANIATESNGSYLTSVATKTAIAAIEDNTLISGREISYLLTGGKQTYDSHDDDNTPTKIVFGDKSDYLTEIAGLTGVDVSVSGNGKIKMYKVMTTGGLDSTTVPEVYILSEDDSTIYANADSSYMFYYCTNNLEIIFDNFDTTKVTDMSYMFYYCLNMSTLDLSCFNTSKVTNMSDMFYYCQSLSMIDISSFDVSSVTDMTEMFSECNKLGMIFVASTWNKSLSNSDTFYNCTKLKGLYKAGNDILYNEFNASNITSAYACIASSSNGGYLTSVAIKNEIATTLGNVLISGMDLNSYIKSGKTGGYSYSNSTYTKIVFGNKSTYSSYISGTTGVDVTQFATGYVKLYIVGEVVYIISENNSTIYANADSSYMFYNFRSLQEMVFDNFDTSRITNMSYMFSWCSSLVNLALLDFDTSNVTNMSYMFYICESLINLDITDFDTSNVTDMSKMFCNCTSIYRLDLSSFNTTSVTNISEMFKFCDRLHIIYVSSPAWSISSSVTCTDAFFACYNLYGYADSSGTQYKKYGTAASAIAAAQLALEGYLTNITLKNQLESNVSNDLLSSSQLNELIKDNEVEAQDSSVTKVVFGNKSTYASVVVGVEGVSVTKGGSDAIKMYCVGSMRYILSEYNTPIAIDNCGSLFNKLTALTEVVFDNLDTSQVTSMNYMFRNCISLVTIDISNLDVTNVTSMTNMFSGCSKLVTVYVADSWNKSLSSSGTFASCSKIRGYYESGDNLAYNAYNSSKTTAAFAKKATSGNYCYLTPVSLKTQVNSELSLYPSNTLLSPKILNAAIKSGNSSYSTENNTITKIVFGNKTTYSSMLGNATGMDVSMAPGEIKLYRVGTVAYVLSESNSTIYASDCSYMFYNFKALTEVVFGNLDTSSVTTMSYMFYNCSEIKTIDMSSLNVVSNIGSESMFYNCTGLRVIYATSSWSKSYTKTFYNCQCLQGFYKDGNSIKSRHSFGSDSGTYARIASSSVSGYLTSVSIKSDVNSFMNVSGKLLPGMALNSCIKSFLHNDNYTTKVIFGKKQNYTQAISSATGEDVSYGGNGSVKLYRVNNIVYILSETNSTIYAAELNKMFYYLMALTEVDFTNLNTASVTDMGDMFNSCSALQSVNLSGLNTSNVTNMSSMFNGCNSLTNINLSGLNTSSVTNMSWMFNGCSSLASINLSSLNTSSVTYMSSMFSDCRALTSLDLSGFSIPNGTDMECMFSNCSKLNVIYVSSTWNTTSNSGGTFAG
ncbi:MAG: BspA family leucine-rich repeat surface protein, partial [Clostridia bacterium]|nr:BspA family leucine-rich repeat surface protein [Clostridia bacterium]